MRPELLCFKYKDLRPVSRMSESDLVNLGWRIRKRYIRHASSPAAKEFLKEFSDSAVDAKVFSLGSVGPVYEALLQAQKWRFDNVHFAIDPPHEVSWDFCGALCSALDTSLIIGSKYLVDTGYALPKAPWELTTNDFAKAMVVEIVKGVCGPLPTSLRFDEASTCSSDFIDWLVRSYPEIEELAVLHEASDVFECLEMFGISITSEEQTLPYIDSNNQKSEASTVVTFESMGNDRLINVSQFGLVTQVSVNERNAFVSAMREDKKSETVLINFMSAFADAIGSRCADEEQIKDFTTYLALSLNRKFEEFAA